MYDDNAESRSLNHLISPRCGPSPVPASASPEPLKIFVLGRFQVVKGDTPLCSLSRMTRKPFELLQALIVFGGTAVGTHVLTDALWPESEGDAAHHALESSLYRLRQLLGVPDAFAMGAGKLSIDRRRFWVDLWALQAELRPEAAGSDASGWLERLRALYQGQLLEQDSDKPWALKARQALHAKFVRCVRDVARAYEDRRLWNEAACLYQTGIEADSLAEDLHRGLIICHRELGNHAEALSAYRRCRELLATVLGVQPNPATVAIYQSVKQRAVAHASIPAMEGCTT